MGQEVLLKAKGLVKDFYVPGGVVSSVAGVDLSIRRGETLALVGESGCGKSTLGRLLLRLIEPTAGRIEFDGTDLSQIKKKQLREFRQRMQIIFQDPFSSLDPRMKVGEIIEEPMKIHGLYGSKQEREARVRELMKRTGIRPEYYNRYPHQFSGGQRQRIGIARALALNPELVVCDEPVSALDVSIQAQILNLLKQLQQEFDLTYIFISHALPSIKHVSTHVAVMYLGRIVEYARTEEIFARPRHPYTEGLMAAVPIPDPELREKREKVILEGDLPSPAAPPPGCHFHTRCRYATEECKKTAPEPRELSPGHFCVCHHPLENAVGTMGHGKG